MRSEHVDRFNHDEDAHDYDADVLDEENPIRAGYDALLRWVANVANELVNARTEPTRVLELGSGTGNLTGQLTGGSELLCVDVSGEMTRIAQQKLKKVSDLGRVSFVNADLLEIFEHPSMEGGFDAAVSTYTIHHLTEEERAIFFRRLAKVLRPGGGFAFGDLAFENEAAQTRILEMYRDTERTVLAEEIEDEYFWNLEISQQSLAAAGFMTETKRFSELSWGIQGRLV